MTYDDLSLEFDDLLTEFGGEEITPLIGGGGEGGGPEADPGSSSSGSSSPGLSYYLRVTVTEIDIDASFIEEIIQDNPTCPICGGTGSSNSSSSGSDSPLGSGGDGESCYPCSLCGNGAPSWFFPEFANDPVLNQLREQMWLIYCFNNCNVPGWMCESSGGGTPGDDPIGVIPSLLVELTDIDFEGQILATLCFDAPVPCDFPLSSSSSM